MFRMHGKYIWGIRPIHILIGTILWILHQLQWQHPPISLVVVVVVVQQD